MRLLSLVLIAAAWAQGQAPPTPWRGAGATPCMGSDGGFFQCPPAARVIAVRAGRLFDSKTGQMAMKQVVLLSGDRITEVGPEGKVKIPAGTQMIDLSTSTVLPGLIDAHTHMFNQRGPKGTTEASMLIAVQNAQADLRAGFTAARDMSSHGNGYGDIAIRDAIKEGRIDGPRYQVSTLGIVWGTSANRPPENPLASKVVRSVEEARAAVREQIGHGADWIKLFPGGAYSFTAHGRGPICHDLSPAGIAGADRRDTQARQESGLPRLWRRRAEERHRRGLRHHRARIWPGSGADQHDGRRKGFITIRRSCATPSLTWTITTRKTPAASTG